MIFDFLNIFTTNNDYCDSMKEGLRCESLDYNEGQSKQPVIKEEPVCESSIYREESTFRLVGRRKAGTIKDMLQSYTIIGSVLGEGISGSIISCTSKLTGTQYALKVLNKNPSAYREIYIQSYLSSKYTIRLIDIYYDRQNIYAIMEYADGGDVFDYYCDKILSEIKVLSLIYKIAILIRHLHEKEVIHGDIKLENVLICNKTLKLCDFGFSVFTSRSHVKRYAYTLPYTAPEHLREMRYSCKSDIWSLGMVGFYFYYNQFPFGYEEGMSKQEVQKCFATNSLVFPTFRESSSYFRKVLSSMLCYEEIKRIDASSLIKILEPHITSKKYKCSYKNN